MGIGKATEFLEKSLEKQALETSSEEERQGHQGQSFKDAAADTSEH